MAVEDEEDVSGLQGKKRTGKFDARDGLDRGEPSDCRDQLHLVALERAWRGSAVYVGRSQERGVD